MKKIVIKTKCKDMVYFNFWEKVDSSSYKSIVNLEEGFVVEYIITKKQISYSMKTEKTFELTYNEFLKILNGKFKIMNISNIEDEDRNLAIKKISEHFDCIPFGDKVFIKSDENIEFEFDFNTSFFISKDVR